MVINNFATYKEEGRLDGVVVDPSEFVDADLDAVHDPTGFGGLNEEYFDTVEPEYRALYADDKYWPISDSADPPQSM